MALLLRRHYVFNPTTPPGQQCLKHAGLWRCGPSHLRKPSCHESLQASGTGSESPLRGGHSPPGGSSVATKDVPPPLFGGCYEAPLNGRGRSGGSEFSSFSAAGTGEQGPDRPCGLLVCVCSSGSDGCAHQLVESGHRHVRRMHAVRCALCCRAPLLQHCMVKAAQSCWNLVLLCSIRMSVNSVCRRTNWLWRHIHWLPACGQPSDRYLHPRLCRPFCRLDVRPCFSAGRAE